MFVCLDCERIFREPQRYSESHGIDTPPYECWDGCPGCGGSYAEARECDGCGKWITGEYIKTKNDERFCENCYVQMVPGDEE